MVVLRCKVALLGEAGVGKSAFSQMVFSGGVTFPKNYMMTMGADFCVKEVRIDEQTSVEIVLVDLGGQEAYRKSLDPFLDGIAHFIVMYDISNKKTFEVCKKWVDYARKENKKIPGTLVANKIDLKDKAEVSDAQGEISARNNQIQFFQMSTLRGVGVMEPIEAIAREFAQHYDERARLLQIMQ